MLDKTWFPIVKRLVPAALRTSVLRTSELLGDFFEADLDRNYQTGSSPTISNLRKLHRVIFVPDTASPSRWRTIVPLLHFRRYFPIGVLQTHVHVSGTAWVVHTVRDSWCNNTTIWTRRTHQLYAALERQITVGSYCTVLELAALTGEQILQVNTAWENTPVTKLSAISLRLELVRGGRIMDYRCPWMVRTNGGTETEPTHRTRICNSTSPRTRIENLGGCQANYFKKQGPDDRVQTPTYKDQKVREDRVELFFACFYCLNEQKYSYDPWLAPIMLIIALYCICRVHLSCCSSARLELLFPTLTPSLWPTSQPSIVDRLL